jgi:CheY-like chemotaxis protein
LVENSNDPSFLAISRLAAHPHGGKIGDGMAGTDGDGRGRRVLLVEDNEQNLELAQFLLEDAGCAVTVARDAAGARAAFSHAPRPDVVLMDMHLPGADGLTLVRELRATPALAQVPIIAVTAHAMRGDRERFLAGGCDGYITKPIRPSTFVAEIEALLDARGAR